MKFNSIILITLLLQLNCNVHAQTNVRGRVITYYYQQQVPMVSAKVDLFVFDGRQAIGNQWIQIASTITDSYGFYFFRGVNFGTYTIWINQTKSYNINVGPIDYRYYSYLDLPQFIF